MGTLRFQGKQLPISAGETVLDCLIRHDQPTSSSCRSGVCQSCLLKAKGPVPEAAQKGLKPSLASQNFFLACQCPAEDGLEIVSSDSLPRFEARVLSTLHLTPDVLQVVISRPPQLEFRAGQFLNLIRPSDGLTRSYSIASLPEEEHIELQVALLPGGLMGQYLSQSGAELYLRGPAGDCFYQPERADEPLLLVGTGTGLAPLVGIVRAALRARHRGSIYLLHGALRREGLYLSEYLHTLSMDHKQLTYQENFLTTSAPGAPALKMGAPEQSAEVPARQDIFEQVKGKFPSLAGFRVYLCGNPEFVQRMKKQCYLAGAAMQAIHSDPFVIAPNAAR